MPYAGIIAPPESTNALKPLYIVHVMNALGGGYSTSFETAREALMATERLRAYGFNVTRITDEAARTIAISELRALAVK